MGGITTVFEGWNAIRTPAGIDRVVFDRTRHNTASAIGTIDRGCGSGNTAHEPRGTDIGTWVRQHSSEADRTTSGAPRAGRSARISLVTEPTPGCPITYLYTLRTAPITRPKTSRLAGGSGSVRCCGTDRGDARRGPVRCCGANRSVPGTGSVRRQLPTRRQHAAAIARSRRRVPERPQVRTVLHSSPGLEIRRVHESKREYGGLKSHRSPAYKSHAAIANLPIDESGRS